MVGSGLFVLLKLECDKIRAAPCEGCLRTLVERIKPFVVRPGFEILTTCFPVRPLWSSYVLCRGNRAFIVRPFWRAYRMNHFQNSYETQFQFSCYFF